MPEAVIMKTLSGFYYVKNGEETIACRARGKFRVDGVYPLAGDRVRYEITGQGTGMINEVLPRRNFFVRPTVANVDYLVIIAANTNPVTDPYLIDRVSVIAEDVGCDVIICINKCDIDSGDELFKIYSKTRYKVIRTSAKTGQGIAHLRDCIRGKTVAFTGNSGVGKSSILNAIEPSFNITTDEVSHHLGRGKHTTRHVELFDIGDETYIADTPGFASFDLAQMKPISKEDLQYKFPDFAEYIGLCRFDDCKHLKEPNCAVTQAVSSGTVSQSRYDSYVRLFDIVSQFKKWEQK